jgi:hypothetical protein
MTIVHVISVINIGATRREMRQLFDECLAEFSDRVEHLFANFENRLGANGSTLFLGRGLESTDINQDRRTHRKVAVLFCNLFRLFL